MLLVSNLFFCLFFAFSLAVFFLLSSFYKGNTPLHSAIECRNKDLPAIVQLLLDADSQGVASKIKDKDGQLPVHSACNRRQQSKQVIGMLVEASPQCLSVKNKKDGLYVLQWAIDRNALDVVGKISHVSPTSFDVKCCKSKVTNKNETPLHYVCYDKPDVPLQMMQVLANNNGNALTTKDSKGKMPLRILYEEGRRKELINCLKEAMGATAFDEMFGDVVDAGQVVVGRK